MSIADRIDRAFAALFPTPIPAAFAKPEVPTCDQGARGARVSHEISDEAIAFSLWRQAEDASRHADALRQLEQICTTTELESFVRIAASGAPLRQFEWFAEMIASHPQMRGTTSHQPEKGTDARR